MLTKENTEIESSGFWFRVSNQNLKNIKFRKERNRGVNSQCQTVPIEARIKW